ncbi:MAG: helix-turn-helix domain-containing protein [Bacteroidota bacterium]
MKILFSPGTILLFTLIVQGVFAALLLGMKRENRQANRYLAGLIFLLSLWIIDPFFRQAGVYEQNPNYYFLPIFWSFGFGPLIYFYVRSLTEYDFKFRGAQFLHFIPALLQGSFYIFLQTQDYAFRRAFWFEYHQPLTYDLELVLSFVSLLLYLVLSGRLIRAYRQRIENHFSNLHRITLRWLGALVLVLSFLTIFWIIEAVARFYLAYYPDTPFSIVTISIAILFLGGGGILQKDLLGTIQAVNQVKEKEATSEEKSISSALLEQVRMVMEKQQLFLNPELTIKDFAQSVGYPMREVSQAINQGLGCSFIDFVNQYRVEAFKNLVADGETSHLSLLGLALESGFNSKSTFNRVFKKMEGISPSEYQKGLKT